MTNAKLILSLIFLGIITSNSYSAENLNKLTGGKYTDQIQLARDTFESDGLTKDMKEYSVKTGCDLMDEFLQNKKEKILKTKERKIKKGNSVEEYAKLINIRALFCGTYKEQTPAGIQRRLIEDLNLK